MGTPIFFDIEDILIYLIMPYRYTNEEYQAMVDCYEECNNSLTQARILFSKRHGKNPTRTTILHVTQRKREYGTFMPVYVDVGTAPGLSVKEREKQRIRSRREKEEKLERQKRNIKKIKRELQREKKKIQREKERCKKEKELKKKIKREKLKSEREHEKNKKIFNALYSNYLVPSFILKAEVGEDISSPLDDGELSDQHEDRKLKSSKTYQDNHEEDEAQNTSDIFQDFEDESWTCPQEVNPIDSDDDNLPLVCKTEESEPNETAIQQITDNPIPDFQCNLCLKEITGFRYRCLVCPDYEMCGECERCGGNHDDHYVLRVPMQRPTAEVEQVESAMRHALSSLPAWKQPSQRAEKRKKTPPKAATKKNLNSTNHEEPENSKSETENETDDFVDQPTETMENRQQTFTETATVKEEVIEFEETAVKLELEPGKVDLVEEAAQDSSSDDSDDVPLSQYPRYVPPSQYPRYVPPTKKRRDDDLHSTTDSPTMQSNGQTKKISSRLRTS